VHTILVRMQCGSVTTWTVQQWGMAASFQFTSPVFPVQDMFMVRKRYKNQTDTHDKTCQQ